MRSNIAKRRSEEEGTLELNNTKRVQRSVEGAKKLFPKECKISKYLQKIVPTFAHSADIS